MTTPTRYLKASFLLRGDLLLTVANASGGVPAVEREVSEVLTRAGLTEIRCTDRSVHTYPSDAQVEVIA